VKVRTLVLALGLACLTPSGVAGDSVPRNPEGCTQRNPKSIAVFMIHHKGSSTPAYIWRGSFRTYVEKVMASGAWPAYKPMESLKAGALAIKQRAHWFVCHPQKGYTWRGRRYHIHNGSARKALRGRADTGQYFRANARVHSKIKRAVDAIWGYGLVKHGRQGKPQWTGDGGRCGGITTGNRLYEDGATDCARKGRSWRWIIRKYLSYSRLQLLGP
jgi:hypothetical protein